MEVQPVLVKRTMLVYSLCLLAEIVGWANLAVPACRHEVVLVPSLVGMYCRGLVAKGIESSTHQRNLATDIASSPYGLFTQASSGLSVTYIVCLSLLVSPCSGLGTFHSSSAAKATVQLNI